MGKGWPEHSPRSTAERHFASESVQSLPPVRVCTPPARGEGAVPRATYTSSSSEVSLERTPRAHAQHGPGRGAAQRPLQHWRSSPAGHDPGHLRLTGIDGQHAQGGFSCGGSMDFRTPQRTPRDSCHLASPAPAMCPQCPDSEARLAAARNAVVDLMQRLTEATEERDEALAAAEREWHLAELLRQELAAMPEHPQAQVASSCGHRSGGLRSSRIPDAADSPDRFDAEWEAAKRHLTMAGDVYLTPRSTFASPADRLQRRHTVGPALAASEAHYTPRQQLSPAQHSPVQQSSPPPLQQGSQSAAGTAKRRSPAQRRLDMDDGSCGGSSSQRLPRYGASAALAFEEAMLRSPPPAVTDPGLLQRLQALAAEAAEACSPPEGVAASGSTGGGSGRFGGREAAFGQAGASRRHRLSSVSQELPSWLADAEAVVGMRHAAGHHAAGIEGGSSSGGGDGDACLSSLGRQQQRPSSPLTQMQEAVLQLSAAAKCVRANTMPLSPAGSAGSSASATGQASSAAARVALKRARIDMLSAVRSLEFRSCEAQQLLSPSKLPLLAGNCA